MSCSTRRDPEARAAPEKKQARQSEEIRCALKDAVAPRVQVQAFGVDGVSTAQHVMPLTQLMQHDSVEEAAQAEAEEDAGRSRKSSPALIY
jgi:hypothetical protein